MKSSKFTRCGLLAVVFFAWVSSSFGSPNRDWAQWLTHYYEHPQPEQLVSAVFGLSRDGYFESAGQPAAAIGFLSATFAQNPDKVADWMVAFRDLPVAHQRLVAAAHWYSGLPGGDRELRQLAAAADSGSQASIELLLTEAPAPLQQVPVLSESSLNLQWGAFLATGEPRYIVNALAALGSGRPGLSETARYSLAQKAAAHPRVYEICQAQIAGQPAGVGDQIRAALADAKTRN